MCIGLSTAWQILIAQFLGSKDRAGVRKTIGTMFSFLGLTALGITIVGILSIDWLLATLNVPVEARAESREYCVVIFFGMVFVFGYNAVAAILRGLGDSKRPLIIISAATLLFVALDIILVPRVGVKGAAIATVISQGISCRGSITYLLVKRDALGLDFTLRSFTIDPAY